VNKIKNEEQKNSSLSLSLDLSISLSLGLYLVVRCDEKQMEKYDEKMESEEVCDRDVV
jgi:hypothetical protein